MGRKGREGGKGEGSNCERERGEEKSENGKGVKVCCGMKEDKKIGKFVCRVR